VVAVLLPEQQVRVDLVLAAMAQSEQQMQVLALLIVAAAVAERGLVRQVQAAKVL
jgi:hypothetical protein